MRSILCCSLLILTFHSPGALGQSANAGTTLHRARAGVLDATGWSTAISTGGDFAVRIPCLFNDFTLSTQAAEPVQRIDVVGCQRDDQRKYSASRFKYRAGAPTARKYLAQISGTQRLEGETARRSILFNGLPAVEVHFQSTARCGSVRSVVIGADLLTLRAEGPRAVCDGVLAEAESFFASLQVSAHAVEEPDQQEQPKIAEDAASP